MDLSGLKWPLIIGVLVLAGWLVSEGGVSFMFNKFTSTSVEQQDAAQQEAYEAGLSRLGGFLIKTFRYRKAEEVFTEAVTRYPEGKNYLYNRYRLAKCAEKQGRYDECVGILIDLRDMDANSYDNRVPNADVLQSRIDKLAETHELGEVGHI
jgi:tetratricopeptide (TPR) repeat protein